MWSMDKVIFSGKMEFFLKFFRYFYKIHQKNADLHVCGVLPSSCFFNIVRMPVVPMKILLFGIFR